MIRRQGRAGEKRSDETTIRSQAVWRTGPVSTPGTSEGNSINKRRCFFRASSKEVESRVTVFTGYSPANNNTAESLEAARIAEAGVSNRDLGTSCKATNKSFWLLQEKKRRELLAETFSGQK